MRAPITILVIAAFVALCVGCSGRPVPTATPSPTSERLGVVRGATADRSVRGVVLGMDGRPVKGASVVIGHTVDATITYCGGTMLTAVERRAEGMPGLDPPAGAIVGQAVTGENGEFVFPGLAEGRFTIAAVDLEHGFQLLPDVASSGAEDRRVQLADATFLTARFHHLPLDPGWSFVDLVGESTYPNVQFALRMENKTTANEFSIGPVPVGGEWRVVARARNQTRAFDVPLLSAPVGLPKGEHNKITIDASVGNDLTGRITGPDDLDAWHELDAQGGTGRGALGEAGGGVVVGQGQRPAPHTRRVVGELRGGVGAVGGGGVGVEVAECRRVQWVLGLEHVAG